MLEVIKTPSKITFKYKHQTFSCQVLGTTPHNDHILLAALTAFNPLLQGIESSLPIDFPISKRMAEATDTDPPGYIDSYEGFIPGLSYSGGLDSTTAAHILENGVALYLSRGTRFDPFAVKAISRLREAGWKGFTVSCDVEHIRTPTGFPVDIACSIPCIINANNFKIDSVAFGTVLESAYSIGRKAYRDYKKSHHYTYWNKLFSAAGLPFNQVTAGLSEVATNLIYQRSGLLGKSCLRNTFGDCKKCYKCYRKYLLNGTLLPTTKGVLQGIKKVHHVNILNYAYEKHGIGKYVDADLLHLEKLYSPAIDLLPEKYQLVVRNRISSLVETMTLEEQHKIETYKVSL